MHDLTISSILNTKQMQQQARAQFSSRKKPDDNWKIFYSEIIITLHMIQVPTEKNSKKKKKKKKKKKRNLAFFISYQKKGQEHKKKRTLIRHFLIYIYTITWMKKKIGKKK